MFKPITFEREDYCPHCNQEKSLLLYDYYGNMFNYPNILDNKNYSIFEVSKNSKTFHYMKCKNCGKEFFIDWSQGKLPRPMFSSFYRSFMRNFKMTKIF